MPTLTAKAVRNLRQMRAEWLNDRRAQKAAMPCHAHWAAASRRLQLRAVHADYLVCRTWDGLTAGDVDIYVAKPAGLRTDWNGQTRAGITYSDYTADGQTRTATDGATMERQHITPIYAPPADGWPGDEIIAIPAHTGLSDPDGHPIALVDANVDGRQWAWRPDQ